MDKKTLREKFTQYYLARRSEEFIKTFDVHRSWSQIQDKIAIRRRNRSIRLTLVASTAVAALIVIGFFVQDSLPKSVPSSSLFADQVKSGARLIMESGEIIVLTDSTEVIDRSVFVEKKGKIPTLVYDSIKNGENQLQTLEVSRGGTYRLELSDGTRVWLNAETRLSYPKMFGRQREVYLTGEAYFEVAKKSDQPFIVHVHNSSVEVLGTCFCVIDYPDQPLQTVLAEGQVRVVSTKDSVILRPNQKAEISLEGTIGVTSVDAAVYVSWISGIYEFVDMPLQTVAMYIARMYNVDVRFEEESLKDVRLTGAIYCHENLGYTLNVLERATDICFSRDGDMIIISKSK